jgi:hypothetical protein
LPDGRACRLHEEIHGNNVIINAEVLLIMQGWTPHEDFRLTLMPQASLSAFKVDQKSSCGVQPCMINRTSALIILH